MRYSYETGQQLSNYTLTPVIKDLNSGTSTRAIVDGSDTRYLSYSEENDGIVFLKMGVSIATGFIVGDHQIATAAHCVYKDNSWRPMEITTYDSNGLPSNTHLTPVEAHIPSAYTTSSAAAYDYALITVEEDLSNHLQFSLGTPYNMTEADYADIPIYVTGCPGVVYDTVSNSDYHLYSEEGRVVGQGNTSVLNYNVDTSGGDSGAPVYTITRNNSAGEITYTYSALAIHKGRPSSDDNYNWGSLITNYHLQFYKNNPNMSY